MSQMTEDRITPDYKSQLSNERWAAHMREHAIHEAAHVREHEDYNERIDKATEALDKRLDTMNEFRAQLTEERATYVRRDQLEEFRVSSEKVTDSLSARIRQLEIERSNLEGRFWAVGLALTAIVVGVNLAVSVLI